MNAQLKLFNRPATLQAIGDRRLTMFFGAFSDELKNANLLLPTPSAANGNYFDALAAALAPVHLLPGRLREALFTIENAAAPENEPSLETAIKLHIPCVSLNRNCPLDCALELFFLAPECLSQFSPPAQETTSQSSSQPSSETLSLGTSEIKNQKSKIENTPKDSESFARLAHLSPANYDRVRKQEARAMGIRVETLDNEVARCRIQIQREEDFNSSLASLHSPEPWPEPVNGAEVLLQVAARFILHIVLPPGGAHAIALWAAHTHCFRAFLHTPRLNLYSPEPDCGKTTTMDLIASMVPRPLRTENLTAPVLFRLVDQHYPTLLLDEVDAYLPQAEELRGLLNAGHKRGACAYRCEGEHNAVRAFNAFGPAALAGIGELPGTLYDRSVRILLLPAEADQLPARFDGMHIEIETELARKLARWAQDNFAALQACDPVLPAAAFNRVADNWRPLFAISQLAGGDWPRLASEAFTALNTPHPDPASEIKIQNSKFKNPDDLTLLADIRQVFSQSGATSISTKELIDSLKALHAARPTPTQELTPMSLARCLRPFGIQSDDIRIRKLRFKGFKLSDFTPLFALYLK